MNIQPPNVHMHFGYRTSLEATCPCGKARCGLVDSRQVSGLCALHGMPSLSQDPIDLPLDSHAAAECPGLSIADPTGARAAA